MKGGALYKPKPRKATPINKESPKRKKENKRYLELLKEKWEEAVINGTNYCIFCGEKIPMREDNHHLDGRIANKLLDTTYWSWAHRECHSLYESGSYTQLVRQVWWGDFLARLKAKFPHLYYKESNKKDKNLELNLE
jgi:hypothetical protein